PRPACAEWADRPAVCRLTRGGRLYAAAAVWAHRPLRAHDRGARPKDRLRAAGHAARNPVRDAAVHGARADAGAGRLWDRAGAGRRDDRRERLADFLACDLSGAALGLYLWPDADLRPRLG